MVRDYAALTRSTTAENEASFQAFHPHELLQLLEQLEELQPVLQGEQPAIHIVRRLDGTRHPTHPSAPTVSWPSAGYVEFMEHAFTTSFSESTQRLILHERAHFLWSRTLPETFKSAWIDLGDWRRNSDTHDGWTSGKTTGFVSSHAHALNPSEDFAESLAYFVVNPDKLRSRSPEKYELIRAAIAGGGFYLSSVRQDLRFEVQNEKPDYVAPGSLRRVSVTVEGAPTEDKLVTIELEIDTQGPLAAAGSAWMRLRSQSGIHMDVRLRPVDHEGKTVKLGTILRGQIRLSRFAEAGYWAPAQIVLGDANGNERFQAAGTFGWKMVVDNPLEDRAAPRYVEASLSLALAAEVQLGRTVYVVTATWGVDENRKMAGARSACRANLVNREAGAHSFTGFGRFEEATAECVTRFELNEHVPGGLYTITSIGMRDAGRNTSVVRFLDEDGEAAPSIVISTASLDTTSPELDHEAVFVSARSTHPESPDGETLVSIVYHARDDASGLGRVSLSLRDPQGVDHRRYHYHENFHSVVYEGDPTLWTRYELGILLPRGSAPGTWELSSMQLRDKVNHIRNVDFTETLRFEVLEE